MVNFTRNTQIAFINIAEKLHEKANCHENTSYVPYRDKSQKSSNTQTKVQLTILNCIYFLQSLFLHQIPAMHLDATLLHLRRPGRESWTPMPTNS